MTFIDRVLQFSPRYCRALDQVALAVEAQQKSAEQLIAERELRRAAEERADRYHEELLAALKAQVDWYARGIRKPVYGADEPQHEAKQPEPINPKPMARQRAAQVTNETLKSLLDDLRAGSGTGVAPDISFGATVGPELSS